MKITSRKLKGVYDLSATPHGDFRGFLVRTYELDVFAASDLIRPLVQESLSHTKKAHTLRGLHVQLPPYSEAKLITPIRGSVKWVVVDLRKGSDTLGDWDSVILSAEIHNSLCVDAGFAHGCLSLTDDCDLVIKSNQRFGAGEGAGIVWNDTTLAIDWGVDGIQPMMSDRDLNYPSFDHFLKSYGGT